MHIRVLKYIIHTIYILHVSATNVAIIREMHYKEYMHRNITEVFGTNAQSLIFYICAVVPKTSVIFLMYVFFVMHLPEDGHMSG
jgi:hypothetical protein